MRSTTTSKTETTTYRESDPNSKSALFLSRADTRKSVQLQARMTWWAQMTDVVVVHAKVFPI